MHQSACTKRQVARSYLQTAAFLWGMGMGMGYHPYMPMQHCYYRGHSILGKKYKMLLNTDEYIL